MEKGVNVHQIYLKMFSSTCPELYFGMDLKQLFPEFKASVKGTHPHIHDNCKRRKTVFIDVYPTSYFAGNADILIKKVKEKHFYPVKNMPNAKFIFKARINCCHTKWA